MNEYANSCALDRRRSPRDWRRLALPAVLARGHRPIRVKMSMMEERMPDQDVEKKKQDTPRDADSGGNMGAGKSGKEGMGSEKPSDGPGRGSQKPGQPRS